MIQSQNASLFMAFGSCDSGLSEHPRCDAIMTVTDTVLGLGDSGFILDPAN